MAEETKSRVRAVESNRAGESVFMPSESGMNVDKSLSAASPARELAIPGHFLKSPAPSVVAVFFLVFADISATIKEIY